MIRRVNKKIDHQVTILSNLWEGILLTCKCGWEYKNSSPWLVRDLVEVCNEHVREQRAKEKSDAE